MPRIAGWYLLKKIIKCASLLFLYIVENFFERARETSVTGLFCECCGNTDHSLCKIKLFRVKVLIVALKDKRTSDDDMKRSLHFKQSLLNYINNQNQQQKTQKISTLLGKKNGEK